MSRTVGAMTTTASNDRNSQAWILVEDDEEFRGVVVMVDPISGDAISLSCRTRIDVDRWEGMSPSFAAYPALRTLDLDKCRYLTQLDESIGLLPDLQRLSLTRCERLTSLPDSIGKLENLEEVFSSRYIVCISLYCA
jgi:hypothetical protein